MKHCVLVPGRIPCHIGFPSHRDGLDRATTCSALCSERTGSPCAPSTPGESHLPAPGMPPSSAGPSERSRNSRRKQEVLPKCPPETRRHTAASEIRRTARGKLPIFDEPCWWSWLWNTCCRQPLLS